MKLPKPKFDLSFDYDYDEWHKKWMDETRDELGEESCPMPCVPHPKNFPMRLCKELGECGCKCADPGSPELRLSHS
jgi:hypothetical protein